jgi:membrane-associated phospholipid phosphatase
MNKQRKLILTYLLISGLLGFILLTAFIVYMPLSSLDKNFSIAVQSYQSPFLDPFMKFISFIGVMPYSVIMVLLTALLFFVFKLKREALFTLSTLFAGVASTIVKILIDRPRPAAPFVHVLEKTVQQSFPSGHVNFYVVFFWIFNCDHVSCQNQSLHFKNSGDYALCFADFTHSNLKGISGCPLVYGCTWRKFIGRFIVVC